MRRPVVVLTGDASSRAALLLLVLLCASLAGCLGKDKDTDTDDPGLFSWLRPARTQAPSPTPVHELERLYGDDSGPCDGCIPLERPPTETPTGPRPTTQPPTLTVPLPNLGDRLHVEGLLLDADLPRSTTPFPIALDSGEYLALIEVAALVPDDDLVLLSLVTYDGTLTTNPDSITPYDETLRVRLADRRIEDIHIRGTGTLPAGGITTNPTEYQVDWTLEPGAFDLFWLGADLWGRQLTQGDTFRTTWAPPGLDHYQVRYTYTVRMVDEHSAELHLRADDTSTNRATWRITVSDDSPYPSDIRRETRYISIHTDRPPLPPIIQHQSTYVTERGDTAIPWGAPPVWPAWSYSANADDTFRPDERLASAALATAPAYPLDDAIADLRLGSMDFSTWWDGHPERVLLEAELVSEHSTGPLAPTRELTWRLTFADGHGHTSGWRVARHHAAGALAPLSHYIEESHPPEVPVLLREIAASDLAGLRLSNGHAAAARLAEMPGEGPIDRAHYRLHAIGDEIGGTLLFGRALPAPPLLIASPGDTWSGHVTEDLRAGAIVSLVQQGPF